MYGLPKNVRVVHLSAPSIGFVYVCCMSEVISSFKTESWITGIFSPYVVSLCDFAYYVVG